MKVLTILSRVFALLGLALLIGAFLAYNSASSFADKAVSVQGEVIDLIEEWGADSDGPVYYPIVRFTTREGSVFEFKSSFGSNPPSYDVGELVGVLYDNANPSDATIKGFWSQYFLTVLLAGLGVIFLAVGLGIMIARIRGRRRREVLRSTGRRITARLTGVSINGRLEVNGRSPWRVDAQWVDPDTGQVHIFHSDNLWHDPTLYLTGDTVDVIIDPSNPKHYAMEIEERPVAVAEG